MRINCDWQVPKEYSNEAPLGGGLGGFSAFKSLFQAPTTTVFVKENSEVLQVHNFKLYDRTIVMIKPYIHR
jgi:hypothetical protein